MHAQEMISTHPHVRGSVNTALARCIDECYDCAQSCVICADAVASRRTGSNEGVIRLTLQACAEACRLCAEECERHADMHEHCRICAESCRRCEEACNAAFQSVQ